MVSCHGTLGSALQNLLPVNVERLYTSGNRYVLYSTLDTCYMQRFGSA